jgi:hypothetical protein
MKWTTLLVLAVVVGITGCATLGAGFAARDVEKAVGLINSQDGFELSRHSSAPFLFEGEMLLRDSDVDAVWHNLSENGFELENPIIVETSKSDETTYMVFSDTEEMEIFFRKYIPEGSTLGKIGTDNGTFYILLGRGVDGYPSILGITGF